MKIKLKLVVVTYNSEKYLKGCLDSIERNKSSFAKIAELKVVILDNSSSNLLKKIALSKGYSLKIEYIDTESNLGFAKAVNIELKKTDFDYVLLLNPDTVLRENTINELLSCAIKNKADIASGITTDAQGNINGSRFKFPDFKTILFDFTNLRKLLPDDRVHKEFYMTNFPETCMQVDVVTGGFMLIKKETVQKVGLFDEKYFMYLEDVDYCLRAKKNGLKTYHCADSKIMHYGGGSTIEAKGSNLSAWFHSRIIYSLKNFSFVENIVLIPVLLIDQILINFKQTIEDALSRHS